MKAIHWDGSSAKLNPKAPGPNLQPDDVLIQVRLAGICATDLQIFRGYMGFRGIPGHEFVGDVIEGPLEWLGKHVVGEISFGCGKCEACKRGMKRHCPYRRVLGIDGADGTFAEFVAVPVANLHVVPGGISDEEAVFTEPLAAALEILEQVHLTPAQSVLVLGDGKLGLLCAQVLSLAGASVTLIGKHEGKLEIVRAHGIQTALQSEWQPAPADVVVEATGSEPGLKLALSMTKPRGTLVLKSTIHGLHNLALAPLVINEVTVVGSRCGPFPPALCLLSQKRVTVTPLIDKIYPLSEGLQAISHAARPDALKVLLRCS